MVGVPRPGTLARPPMLADARPTVLVVDDAADMRAYIRGCLGTGFSVAEAASGDEALRLARADVPALVVTDLRMPGLDGLALCAALHADPATATVPVLLVSGEPPAPSACIDGFLAKPFNATGLRAAVAVLVPP